MTQMTIMLVDDTPANLLLLGDILRQEGYRVVQFPNGPLALRAASDQPPDLVVLDIRMPEMDGFEVCQRLKQHAKLANVPVIFISAATDVDSKIQAFEMGGADYVTKPFERGEIVARVRTQLELVRARRLQEAHRQELEQQVRERTAHLTRAQRMAGLGSWTIDLETDTLHWFEESWRLFGLPAGNSIPLEDLIEQVHPDDRQAVLNAWNAAVQSGNASDYDLTYRVMAEGQTRWLKENIGFEYDQHGRPYRATGSVLDVSESRRVQQQLRLQQQQLRSAMTAARSGAWQWDVTTRTLMADEGWCALIGYQLEALEPINLSRWKSLAHPEDQKRVMDAIGDLLSGRQTSYEIEYRIKHRNGDWVWLRSSGGVVEHDDASGIISIAGIDVDITAQKNRQLERQRLARLDALTNLPNRTGLSEQLLMAIGSVSDDSDTLVVAYIDLDGLAMVNDRFGRATGDALIIESSKRIQRVAPDGAIIARMGGDEFVLVLPSTSLGTGEDVTRDILATLAEPVELPDGTIRLTASAGLTCLSAESQEDDEQLLRQAAQALYEAKLKGSDRLERFDKQGEAARRRQYVKLDAIRHALAQRQFVLHYQPKVDMLEGAVTGFEALIRWQHPERGMIPPGEFIPVLTNQPLAIDVGNWVIEEAIRQLGLWNQSGLETRISVNVEGHQLLDPGFFSGLMHRLTQSGQVRPEQLELEILETSVMDDIDHASQLVGRLNESGVQVALDDYGTGYSSLTFLKRLPVKTIKIDQSFVRDLLVDPEHQVIIEGIVGLAGKLNRQVIAEGVETEAHGECLINLGCRYAQGYGIGRPMPAEAVTGWLEHWTLPASWQNRR